MVEHNAITTAGGKHLTFNGVHMPGYVGIFFLVTLVMLTEHLPGRNANNQSDAHLSGIGRSSLIFFVVIVSNEGGICDGVVGKEFGVICHLFL